MSDNEWLGAAQAQDYLGRTDRQLRRYAERGRVRTRKRGGRVEYNRADLDTIKETIEDDPAPRSNQQIVPAGELLGIVRELQDALQQSAAREGYLRAQLEQRLALPDERMLRDELAAERAHRTQLEQALKQVQGRSNYGWIVAALVLVLLIAAIIYFLFIR